MLQKQGGKEGKTVMENMQRHRRGKERPQEWVSAIETKR